MRSMERSHSRGIDQAHVANDRNNIETRRHGGGTTWDDLINVPFSGNRSDNLIMSRNVVSDVKAMKALIDSLPTDADGEKVSSEHKPDDPERLALINKAIEIRSSAHGKAYSDHIQSEVGVFRRGEI